MFIIFIFAKFVYEIVLSLIGLHIIIDYKSLKIAIFLLPIFYLIDYLNTKIKKQ